MDISEGATYWVFDTSSLINVKELIKPAYRAYVLDALAHRCQTGHVLFPPEVVDELNNGIKRGRPDAPLWWAKANRQQGCRLGRCYDELVAVMNHAVAKLTADPDQTGGEDDADPHVLATALKVASRGGEPIVVTQESRKSFPQVPLNVAAGSLGLPSVTLYAGLISMGVWQDHMRN